MNKYICIDIGGTSIKYGIADANGKLLYSNQTPTIAKEGGPGIVRRVKSLIDDQLKTEQCGGIALSTAGMVDPNKGIITYSGPQIPNYKGTQWKRIIQDGYALPCSVENDVNCAGLAESISGAGKGYDPCLCLTIGTGIGGCLLLNKQIFHGATHSAMEIGYMKMRGKTFQELASASALLRCIAKQKGNPEKINGKVIFELARAGDSICINEIDYMVDCLAEGIANICYVINPQAVILGGGIMAEDTYFSPRLSAALKKYLLPELYENLHIAFAKHRNHAGMLGAFYHFQNENRHLFNK